MYEEVWARDVDAMVGYHAGASQAAAEIPGVTAGKLSIGPAVARNLAQLFKRLPKAVNRLRKYDDRIGRTIKKYEVDLGQGFVENVQGVIEDIYLATQGPRIRAEFRNSLNQILGNGLPLIAPGGGIGIIRR